MAFRSTQDPYAILVSEAMAQQTQAARAATYWESFVARWPTVGDLAGAPLADVLRAWRGLGYNRRAVNLHRAAHAIVREHGGVVPADIEVLERLPGVGPYTARAVAALAFGVPVGAVDVNVRRVLSRVTSGSAGGVPGVALQRLADHLVPAERPGHWTHALMDVGATFCRPRAPRCDACPARVACRFAAEHGAAEHGAAEPGTVAADGLRHGRPDGSRPAVRERPVRFATTNRWLRGRILDALRDGEPGSWVDLGGPIGEHPPTAVAAAAAGLARDGLAEIDPESPNRARLPIG